MSNWKLINKTYLYDGTFYGLLTIVFDSYIHKTLPQKIYNKDTYIYNFLDKTIEITTDFDKSQRVFNGIEKNIGYKALYNRYYAFLSNQENKEIYILKYLCDGFDIGPKINDNLTTSYVFKTINMRKRALAECHKFKGLLRFQEISDNLCYASIHPDNNILEPLGHHFINRLSSINFIIHDKNRNICFVYNNKNYKIINGTYINIPEFTENEKMYQELWKMFFKTISIKERKNPRCQMQFMPKKYWKDLIEEPD